MDASDEDKCDSPGCGNRGLPATCVDNDMSCVWAYRLCNFCFATTSRSSKLIIARLTGTKIR